MKAESSSDAGLRGPARRAAALVSVLALGLLASCSTGGNPFGGNGGGNNGSGMVIRGTVLNDQGVEVFETVIRVTAYLYEDDLCGSVPVADPFETAVNEQGEYSLLLEFDRDEFDACLDLEVLPPPGSGYLHDQQFFFDQEMNEFDSGETILSLRLDFTLERE